MSLSAARRKGNPEILEQAVAQAIENLEHGISNLRALVTDLRPPALDQLGLAAALEALCERASRHGLEIDSSVELAYEQGREPARHTAELETGIYRIIQEALTNATKHGHAKRAVIEVAGKRRAPSRSPSATTATGLIRPPAPPASACSGSASASNCSTEPSRSNPPRQTAPPSQQAFPPSASPLAPPRRQIRSPPARGPDPPRETLTRAWTAAANARSHPRRAAQDPSGRPVSSSTPDR